MEDGSLSDGVPCKREGCPGQGTWIPVIVLRPSGNRKEVRATLPSIKICEQHRAESSLDTFLSPEGFSKIEKFLRENGKGNFQRRGAKLDWQRNEEDGLLAF